MALCVSRRSRRSRELTLTLFSATCARVGAGAAQAVAGAIRACAVIARWSKRHRLSRFRAKADRPAKGIRPDAEVDHPEYPFWRLQNDGIWVVDDADHLRRRTGQTDITKRELLDQNANAPFSVADVAFRLLDGHFPISLHSDILEAVGLDLCLTQSVSRRKRDPAFRGRMLTAYNYACAVCGFGVRLSSREVIAKN